MNCIPLLFAQNDMGAFDSKAEGTIVEGMELPHSALLSASQHQARGSEEVSLWSLRLGVSPDDLFCHLAVLEEG